MHLESELHHNFVWQLNLSLPTMCFSEQIMAIALFYSILSQEQTYGIILCAKNSRGIPWEDFKIGSLDLKKEYMWDRVTYHVHVCLELLTVLQT